MARGAVVYYSIARPLIDLTDLEAVGLPKPRATDRLRDAVLKHFKLKLRIVLSLCYPAVREILAKPAKSWVSLGGPSSLS